MKHKTNNRNRISLFKLENVTVRLQRLVLLLHCICSEYVGLLQLMFKLFVNLIIA